MPLYGVIDCAAADWLLQAVEHEAAGRPLLEGPLDAELRAAAPHVVRFEAESPFLTWMMQAPDARSLAAGCVLHSVLDMPALRRELRRKLMARLPDGNVVMFRFYDPRILAAYFDSLTAEEQVPWTRHITDWWLPLPEGVLHYRRAESGTLGKHRVTQAK
jgi:hypothetical protein